MDGDESRRKALESGREMLAKYKAQRFSRGHSSANNQAGEPSDEESSHNEFEAQQSISDITHSSISMSEGEGDGDLEGRAGNVAKLAELLQVKEAEVEALHAELDHLRAEASSPNSSQSRSSSIQNRDIILTYHNKLTEYEKAVIDRDKLIDDLTSSLKQALAARDNLVAQVNSLNALKLANTSMESAEVLQEKVSSLEITINDQGAMINELNMELTKSKDHVQRLEMERDTQRVEINDYKTRVEQLNKQIRVGAEQNNLNIDKTLEQQKQYEARVDKLKKDMQTFVDKFTIATNESTTHHQKEINDLQKKHEADLANLRQKFEEQLKLSKEESKTLADRLNKELPDLESRHAKELSAFQSQLAYYKNTVEALKLELINRCEREQSLQAELLASKSRLNELIVQANTERELLQEQIRLHKLQVDEVTSKCLAASSVLDSKESIERSLEQALSNAGMLREENEKLRMELDDLSVRYTAAQSLIENNLAHERSMNNRVYELEKSLSRVSGMSFSNTSELNETSYQTFDEVALQFHITRQKLEEKAELEKKLIDKIQNLEEELEKANLVKESYEKQLKDSKNSFDKLTSEMNVLKDSNPPIPFQGSMYFGDSHDKSLEDKITDDSQNPMEILEKNLEELKTKLKQKEAESADNVRRLEEITQRMRKSEDECEKLKSGLASAWEQCAFFEEKLNQTLAMSESRFDDSMISERMSELSQLSKNISKDHLDSHDTSGRMSESHDRSKDNTRDFVDLPKVSSVSTKVVNDNIKNNDMVNISHGSDLQETPNPIVEDATKDFSRSFQEHFLRTSSNAEELPKQISQDSDNTSKDLSRNNFERTDNSLSGSNEVELLDSNKKLESKKAMNPDTSRDSLKEAILVNEELVRTLQKKEEECQEIMGKLNMYTEQVEVLNMEKAKLIGEKLGLVKGLEELESLRDQLERLKKDQELLAKESTDLTEKHKKEMSNLIERHTEEVAAIKVDASNEVQKLRNLLLSVKEGTAGLDELRNELESRHSHEMEDLRTYFEQKCLQMEKQYSEEVFSQQSRKISDDDSEFDELIEDPFFGAAGDCLGAETKSRKSEDASKIKSDSGDNEDPLTPTREIQELKEQYERKLIEQKQFYENLLEETPGKRQDSLTKDEVQFDSLEEEEPQKLDEIEKVREEYQKKLAEQEKLYENLLCEATKKRQDSLLNVVSQPCQTEWDTVTLENGELANLRAAYSHQLEEQVALARLDIVNALQEQIQRDIGIIQALLSADTETEENWPAELLELRNKFTDNTRHEMQCLKEMHSVELQRLKEEHSRSLARIIDRHQEELTGLRKEYADQAVTRKQLSSATLEDDLIAERDNLRKSCMTLKNLVGDLIKYFMSCEEEVNNTLISEVLKSQLSKTQESSDQTSVSDVEEPSMNKIKRVHFAPNSSGISSILNNQDPQDLAQDEQDFAQQLRTELDHCLNRLRIESAQILGISLPTRQCKVDIFSKPISWSNKTNEELQYQLAESEAIITELREESEHLRFRVLELQDRLVAAETKKEIISEGYGEQEDPGVPVSVESLCQLQDKARSVLNNGGGDNSYLLQLIEELCRHSDKLLDDSKRDKEDLQLQVPLDPIPPPYIHRVCCRKIESADKKLRAITKFLEEQGGEREAEREEAARQIQALQEQIKEMEREKERDQRISTEQSSTLSPLPTPLALAVLGPTDIAATVEALESQMREMSSLMMDAETKKSEIETELKDAVDKICDLRDIIADLEQQLQLKHKAENIFRSKIEQLEGVVAAQTRNQQELAQELDAVNMGSESNKLTEHIARLEDELQKHKLSSEHFEGNSSALKQMKTELREMQLQLDRRIRDLEALHICGSSLSLSQPSEDVSIREQIDASRCPTPDDPHAPPTLPLDQLLKLKEKMVKHARVEEVAFKRIKDLEMHLTALKNQNEELQAEQEILQQTASEQLFQIEAMRGRLEQQKQSAPFAQRQATSRLELQLHELNTKLNALERTVSDKDLEIKDVKSQLDRANRLLTEKEAEMASAVHTENNAFQKLKDYIAILEEEKKVLESKLGIQERTQHDLRQLIDSMVGDKNEEIDHLKEQLMKRERVLEPYLALNLDESQLRELIRQAEPKNSARTLSDILSIHSECEDLPDPIRETPNHTSGLNVSSFRTALPLDHLKEPAEQSPNVCITIPQLELGSQSSSSSSHGKSPEQSESHPIQALSPMILEESNPKDRTSEAIQRSNNELLERQIRQLENQLSNMKDELNLKSSNLARREAELNTVQQELDELRIELKDTIESLNRDKLFYKNQYELSQVSESKIKKDLLQVENTLKLKDDEVKEYKSKIQMNEKILMELNAENSRLKNEIDEIREKNIKRLEINLQEKEVELKNLKEIAFEKDITIETIQTRNAEIENENKQLFEFKSNYEQCRREFAECQNEIQRLTEGLNNRDQIIRRLEEMARRSSFSGASSPSECKDQEIHHLQEYLKEKDKVIRQMSDDSKSLHRALETIQNKMKESGNVVELRKKLKDERRINTELKEIVDKMQIELKFLLRDESIQSEEEVNIEDMVQRELNLSARLDQQILEAIESEPEEGTGRKIEKHSCNSLDIQPTNSDKQERFLYRYGELKSKLKQATKVNEELIKLKDDLEIEREMLRSQITEYENRILQIKSHLDEESNKVASLDEALSAERQTVRDLKLQIQKDQHSMEIAHIKDSELISMLRIKLSSSIDAEEKLRKDLNEMRYEHKSLETQLTAIREQINSQRVHETTAGLEELLATEQKKYIKLAEEYEQVQRKNVELRDTLRKIENEKSRYEKQLEMFMEEKEKMISSLTLAEGTKEFLSTDLRRTKEELRAREEECEWLQQRISTMSNAENKRQQQRSDDHNELKSLRRAITSTREVMHDLESDMKQSKKELQKSLENQAQLTKRIESLTENEIQLNKQLNAARLEEKRLNEVIADMQNDLQLSVKREVELTEELQRERISSQKKVPSQFVQKIEELNDSIERHSRVESMLQEKLAKAREEKEQFASRIRLLENKLVQRSKESTSGINSDLAEKIQHFYGKYLRVDSRRKALVYQKRYLLCIVGGYQISEANTLSVLAQLTQSQKFCIKTSDNRKSPKVRFRSAILVVISIHRMKWMILRWRTGRRVGANAVLGNPDQSFVPLRTASFNHSPPVRERATINGDGNFGKIELEQYLQRFTNIQQTLGLAMSEAGASRPSNTRTQVTSHRNRSPQIQLDDKKSIDSLDNCFY
ncbi:A-kinase anchor protein 9 isoform X5 [Cephus cinctus]|uniref:A-kinase anchor protein 9 isoform X5 n=1 Tax=Cephus cinctus TaxID=211228 RepID=A0AAJ7RNX5_CEPCN|nr:A-kinase anchor protein 9 isoform X5 [Cephus cinctus]